MRLRCDCAYDGSQFFGWARQPQLRTVQGVIEDAMAMVLRADEQERACLRLTVAGRTDTGVHARHQVCHVDIEPEMLDRCVGHMAVDGAVALQRRLRHVLPDDVCIHAVSEAPDGFDARFSALERTYVYRICDDPELLDPRLRSMVLPVCTPLDMDAMNEAAALMLGLHDFGSFATANPHGTTIREVKAAHWQRVPIEPLGVAPVRLGHNGDYVVSHVEGGLLCFTIVADAFAHNMVRSLVNACVQIGMGRKTLSWFADKMAHPLREGSTGPIAPGGLTLEHVAYPPDDQLALRAQSIRAKRTLPQSHVS